ncbi:MAG: dTDP-glucose 4,6-dehydratase [Pseudobdellovibrionaceae bacterium]
MTLLVTGGAGFIGSNFVHYWLQNYAEPLVVLDKLTYAGNIHSLDDVAGDERFTFVHGDILDSDLFSSLLESYAPRAIIHFAAESHVDRSIDTPEDFIQTNIVGTFRLLNTARQWWMTKSAAEKARFRFLHISTDEVYGSLGPDDAPFAEDNRYEPNSPYSASKAAADHLVRAFYHTYRFPVLTTNCSNNYGPYQFPEKLIPLMIHNALKGLPLPVYGDGLNVRDWLYVEDHCKALIRVLEDGRAGETYNIGGECEMKNIDVVNILCAALDHYAPKDDGASYAAQITFVTDRLGHDRRYAIDAGKISAELGWHPEESFETGLHKTVQWYLANSLWVKDVLARD